MKIIVINGQGGVGKDTFVSYCQDISSYVFNYSMVDGIKRCARLLDWTGKKDERDRKFLSDLKDLASNYNDYPFKDALNNIRYEVQRCRRNYVLENQIICFVHAREPEDIYRWVHDYQAKTLLIRRKEVEGTYGNHADDSVFDINYDYIIYNNHDLSWLKQEAELFMYTINKQNWESDLYGKDD